MVTPHACCCIFRSLPLWFAAALSCAWCNRYGPLNCNVTLFRKAKLELYSPDSHPRGLVARLFKYKDFERTLLVEQVEMFQKRADKLRKRVRYPLQRRVEEFFDSGRDHHLKKHSEVLGRWREMEFYATAHIEGLVKRTEVIREKITETFRDRVDHLTYRSVSLLPQGVDTSSGRSGGRKPAAKMGQFVLHVEPGDLAMRKMTQKFSRSPEVDADKDVQKRTYFVQDKTIREDYHYAEGRIMASSRVYHKDAPDGQHVELRFVNPFADPPKPSELDADFRRVVALEKDCSHDIREATRLASEIMWTRAQCVLAACASPASPPRGCCCAAAHHPAPPPCCALWLAAGTSWPSTSTRRSSTRHGRRAWRRRRRRLRKKSTRTSRRRARWTTSSPSCPSARTRTTHPRRR